MFENKRKNLFGMTEESVERIVIKIGINWECGTY